MTEELVRPDWARTDELLRHYYDTEWGVPVTDERGVYERLCLEGFQAGLSWRTVLAKREAFREVFAGFVPEVVATFTEDDVERIAADARVIRHRGKIRAAISNAQVTLDLRERAGADASVQGFEIPRVSGDPLVIELGLPALVWSFKPEVTPIPRVLADIPTQDAHSATLAKALKKEGMKFIGPTSAYALMEAIGVIDTHLVDSHRRGISRLYAE
ncbi:DNA-3-methyladenine glycosylase I [Rothia sp. ZJ932]|uniref:DNA-3-methyladenine glycosylase I n=1 Tax=Rothia sp. ZJ932 TaxID=2810516 RepID=UPI001967D078|nr:DNA-3-methyladenine glycosylase I [Rothia sp. ZJ932]QRZ60968.1 DNA-3-methyladenine glycosylase I [Rothia sp. ZJ932]